MANNNSEVANFIQNFRKMLTAVSDNGKKQFQQSVHNNANQGVSGAMNVLNDLKNIRTSGRDIISGKTVVNPADNYNWSNDSSPYVRGTSLDPMSPVTLNGGPENVAQRMADEEKMNSKSGVLNPADQYGKYDPDAKTYNPAEDVKNQTNFLEELRKQAKDLGISEKDMTMNVKDNIKKIQDAINKKAEEEAEDIVEYTYKPGDTFGQVILDLGIETDKGLWGSDGDVQYYTKQLREQGIPGMVPIGTTIRLKRRK